eukprot:403350518
MPQRRSLIGMQYLAESIRPFVQKNVQRFPMSQYLRIIYNDALTYDPKTQTGGLKCNYKNSSVARAPQNRHLQLLMNELQTLKSHQEDIVLDNLSDADYLAAAGVMILKEAHGPNILNDFTYGRKEISHSNELGSVDNIPTAKNYRSNLQAKGFTDDEIVALASLEAIGHIHDPELGKTTYYEKLDNSFYQQINLGKAQNVAVASTLTGDAELKAIVDKYAQDRKAFNQNLGTAFLKMIDLGHSSEELIHIETLMEHHPFATFWLKPLTHQVSPKQTQLQSINKFRASSQLNSVKNKAIRPSINGMNYDSLNASLKTLTFQAKMSTGDINQDMAIQSKQQLLQQYISTQQLLRESFAINQERIPSPRDFRNSWEDNFALDDKIFRQSLRHQGGRSALRLLNLSKLQQSFHQDGEKHDIQEQNKMKTTKDLGFAVPSFYEEDQERFFKRRKNNRQMGKKSINLSYVADNIDFLNSTKTYQPHLMRRSSDNGSNFPNSSQLNFELNLRQSMNSQNLNNTQLTNKSSQRWDHPGRRSDFSKYYQSQLSPGLNDTSKMLDLSPDQIQKIRKYQDKLHQKNHNEMRHLFGTGYLKQNADWITNLRDSVYEKKSTGVQYTSKELSGINSSKNHDQLRNH